MESNQSQFLTRHEAAKFLNLKKSTLDAWATRGGGPLFLKFGRTVRYRQKDLLAWVESRIRKNTSEAL